VPLGNDLFRQNVVAKLKCKVGQARRGRPHAPEQNQGGVWAMTG